MEKDRMLNLTFASSLTDLREVNSSFDTGVLRIAYPGKNRKRSSISKEVFERCIDSIYNCPIVCNYDRDTETLGGHDMDVVKESDGSIRIVNATTPVGVVPESAKWWFDTVTEDDGTEREYLFADALIWKRQEAYKKIKEDGITAQSMEIKIKDADIKDNFMQINDFEFTAFCLIGVEPCYESASLVFSQDEFKNQLSEMMHDLKESFSLVNTPDGDDNIHPQKYSMEGGNQVLDEKMELIAKYGIDVESLDFSIEDFTVEELTEKFEAMKAASEVVEPKADEPQEEPVDEPKEDNADFSLNSGDIAVLRATLESELVQKPWGSERRYSYIDCDNELSEVYAYDYEDHCFVYGFKFTKDGDNFVIDYDSRKRKKFALVDFNEGNTVEQNVSLEEVFSNIDRVIKDNAEMEEKYNTASEKITSLESELSELREFKASIESAEAEKKRNAVFALFEDLNGIEAFENLKANCSDMTEDVLKKECFAIRGEFGIQLKFSNEPENNPKLKVVKTQMDDAPYGGIVEEYLGCK